MAYRGVHVLGPRQAGVPHMEGIATDTYQGSDNRELHARERQLRFFKKTTGRFFMTTTWIVFLTTTWTTRTTFCLRRQPPSTESEVKRKKIISVYREKVV